MTDRRCHAERVFSRIRQNNSAKDSFFSNERSFKRPYLRDLRRIRNLLRFVMRVRTGNFY